MEKIVQISRLHFPVTTLGYGRRIGIWTQGCSIRCPGCVSRDTWERRSELGVPVSEIIRSLRPWLSVADGVTLSGGEPFDQAVGIRELLLQLRSEFDGDILAFSGYSRADLDSRHPDIVQMLDVVITEPFAQGAKQTLALRGSDNQRVFLLTELARRRYPEGIDHLPWGEKRGLDVVVHEDGVWMAGIPRQEDMARLREQLAMRGFACRGSDQRRTIVRA